MVITHKKVRALAKLSDAIHRRRISIFGQVNRTDESRLPKQIFADRNRNDNIWRKYWDETIRNKITKFMGFPEKER